MEKLRTSLALTRTPVPPSSLKVLTELMPEISSLPPRLKLAIFDLDDTLITTKSGSRFPRDIEDWKLAFPDIPKVLRQLEEAEFTILIITNQLGISQGFFEFAHFRSIVSAFLAECKVEAFVFASQNDDEYRKPAIGAYEFFWELIGRKRRPKEPIEGLLGKRGVLQEVVGEDPNYGGVSTQIRKRTDKSRALQRSLLPNFYIKAPPDWIFGLGYDLDPDSFYCGDAAGRSENDQRDFSDSDVLFAVNARLNFLLPEQIFAHSKVQPMKELPSHRFPEPIELCPKKFQKELNLDCLQSRSKQNLLVLLMGPPGCGKTHFCSSYLQGHHHINYVD